MRSGTTVTEAEVAAALAALGDGSIRVPVRAWPGALGGLDHPGLYAWWVDSSGAGMLSAGFDAEVATGRIYAGQAGATAWPSGTKRLAHAPQQDRRQPHPGLGPRVDVPADAGGRSPCTPQV